MFSQASMNAVLMNSQTGPTTALIFSQSPIQNSRKPSQFFQR